MNSCDFGIYLKDECHKNTYTRTQGFKTFTELSGDIKETLLWRSGISGKEDESGIICYHHEYVFGTVFERKFTKCCDVFNTHTKRAKGIV